MRVGGKGRRVETGVAVRNDESAHGFWMRLVVVEWVGGHRTRAVSARWTPPPPPARDALQNGPG
jgi:hypothetical protein